MAWFEVGLPADRPVLILHGGPGGRSRAASVNWFEGLGVRCIAFDQRGCGSSTPVGDCHDNSLPHLVADIERLRLHLGLARWAVAGGSWGSTLALAYAASHPERIEGLFLRSSFLASPSEVDAFFAPWSAWLGPAGAQALAAPLGWAAGSADSGLVPSPVQLLQAVTAACAPGTGNALSGPPAVVMDPARGAALAARIAAAWDDFEQAQSQPGGLAARPELRWSPRSEVTTAGTAPPAWPAGLQVQQHYLAHHCFADGAERACWLHRLRELPPDRPVTLVHGLGDAVCAPVISQRLAACRPGAVLHEVPEAGHAMDHPALAAALSRAAAQWVAQLPVPRA